MRHEGMNRLDERGAVALLTTIIIGILLSIITTGLITVMVSELRQSDDAEQSIRAYYAAQSGVEDAVSKVIAALPGRASQVCPGAGTTNTNLDPASPGQVGWTCQQISYSGSPSGSLPVPDKATQIDVGANNPPGFRSMNLQWDETPPPYGVNYFNAPVGNFPAAASGWPYAAALELVIIEYPSGSFNAASGQIVMKNVLAVPTTSGAGIVNYSSISGSNPVAGHCNPAAASYHCSLLISNMSINKSYTFRLRSRYLGTDYRMDFYRAPNGNGPLVNVPDGMATIDITAKAGDVFRRVIYKVPYRNGAATGLDYVIYSDTDVCKNFVVLSGNVQNGTCPAFP